MIDLNSIKLIGAGFISAFFLIFLYSLIHKVFLKVKLRKLKKKVELIEPKENIVIPLPKKEKKIKVKKEKKKKEEKPYVFKDDLRELNPKPKLKYRPKHYQGNRYVRGFK